MSSIGILPIDLEDELPCQSPEFAAKTWRFNRVTSFDFLYQVL